jgi:hypothetical protein
MPRTKRHRKKTEEEYIDLAIRVDHYDAETDASINHNAYHPQHAFNLDDRDPLYRFITRLTDLSIKCRTGLGFLRKYAVTQDGWHGSLYCRAVRVRS